MHADDFQELDGKDELAGVTLDIFNKDGDKYDHVKCAKADFDVGRGILYSEGEVEITMNVPEQRTAHRPSDGDQIHGRQRGKQDR